ncbi:MAG: hypothetical protein FWD23_04630 [Oscillospiraceae bacterium]|nr:hypothetical protein [Oscillospiraceae bacterium]
MAIKRLYLFLILALVFSLFASCGETNQTAGETGDENSKDADSANGKTDDGTSEQNIYEQFPKTDFGGRDFTILLFEYMQEEHYSESEIGDVFNDAVYNRNKKIEDDFNINLKFRANIYGEVTNDLKKSVLGGDNAYDLGAMHAVAGASVVGDNLYTDWNKADVIKENLDKPWWNKNVVNGMSIGGKSFFLAGDIGYIFTAHTHAFLFNKKLFAEAGMEYPYETVKNGKWTYDAFEAAIKNCNQDLNGDGKLDIKDDRFGFTSMGLFADTMYFYSFGGKIVEKDENDYPVLVLGSERNALAIDTGYRWFIGNSCPVTVYTGDDDYTRELSHIAFHLDRVYFLGTNLKNLRVFRDMESEYGIVPFPKLDDSQPDYISNVDGAATMLVLPKGVNIEVSAVIAEALARQSSITVIPAYYDSTLQLKFTRDEPTTEMLKILKDTAYFDLGYIYNFAGSGFVSRDLILQKSANLASYYEKNEARIQKDIDKLIAYCQNME